MSPCLSDCIIVCRHLKWDLSLLGTQGVNVEEVGVAGVVGVVGLSLNLDG